MYETGRFANVDPSHVVTREDAILVIEAMTNDLRSHPEAWENATLDSFFEALGASLASRLGSQPDAPTWRLFAQALVVASGYEYRY